MVEECGACPDEPEVAAFVSHVVNVLTTTTIWGDVVEYTPPTGMCIFVCDHAGEHIRVVHVSTALQGNPVYDRMIQRCNARLPVRLG
jgi:hypothetical protein